MTAPIPVPVPDEVVDAACLVWLSGRRYVPQSDLRARVAIDIVLSHLSSGFTSAQHHRVREYARRAIERHE